MHGRWASKTCLLEQSTTSVHELWSYEVILGALAEPNIYELCSLVSASSYACVNFHLAEIIHRTREHIFTYSKIPSGLRDPHPSPPVIEKRQ
jgi:hypothetical protein